MNQLRVKLNQQIMPCRSFSKQFKKTYDHSAKEKGEEFPLSARLLCTPYEQIKPNSKCFEFTNAWVVRGSRKRNVFKITDVLHGKRHMNTLSGDNKDAVKKKELGADGVKKEPSKVFCGQILGDRDPLPNGYGCIKNGTTQSKHNSAENTPNPSSVQLIKSEEDNSIKNALTDNKITEKILKPNDSKFSDYEDENNEGMYGNDAESKNLEALYLAVVEANPRGRSRTNPEGKVYEWLKSETFQSVEEKIPQGVKQKTLTTVEKKEEIVLRPIHPSEVASQMKPESDALALCKLLTTTTTKVTDISVLPMYINKSKDESALASNIADRLESPENIKKPDEEIRISGCQKGNEGEEGKKDIGCVLFPVKSSQQEDKTSPCTLGQVFAERNMQQKCSLGEGVLGKKKKEFSLEKEIINFSSSPEKLQEFANNFKIRSDIVNPHKGKVGPGAEKDGVYKNAEYYSYHAGSYLNAELELVCYRCQQPSSINPKKKGK